MRSKTLIIFGVWLVLLTCGPIKPFSVTETSWRLEASPTTDDRDESFSFEHIIFRGDDKSGAVDIGGIGTSLGNYVLQESVITWQMTVDGNVPCSYDFKGSFTSESQIQGSYSRSCENGWKEQGLFTATRNPE